jgi:hypothetical protein
MLKVIMLVCSSVSKKIRKMKCKCPSIKKNPAAGSAFGVWPHRVMKIWRNFRKRYSCHCQGA